MNKKSLLSMVIAGGLTLSCASNIFALNLNVANQQPIRPTVNVNNMIRNNQGFNLSNLIEKGIITQEQATAWEAFVQEKEEERQAEIQSIQSMTEEERQAYLVENKEENKSLLEELVEAGIITEEQAEEIKLTMPQQKNQQGFRNIISLALEEGIITEDEATAWEAFNQEKEEERQAEIQSIQSMTEEEKRAYLEKNKEENKPLFEELVEEGIITEEQVEQIQELLMK
ncbi:hypothetical protein [Defluviitalea phaphyphila]|uniref:hypothetical protein n=1 Tax=Defluviitalea phaphyphila TaxID=1473580 RepID=UPI0007306652|nr:hypothetical protein [Defluviitalea phaphyphila]